MTSMSLTMIEGIKLVGATAPVTIPWTRTASGWMLIVVDPAAFLFAAVMVAIGAMARSFKEAQIAAHARLLPVLHAVARRGPR